MNRIFVDLDGVLIDFEGCKTSSVLTGEEIKTRPGVYLTMQAIPGALDAVRSLIGMGFDVWIAIQPTTGAPQACRHKAAWVLQHIPELKLRIIIAQDKELPGDQGDYLCDSRFSKGSHEYFPGTLLCFVDGYHWPQALEHFCIIKKKKTDRLLAWSSHYPKREGRYLHKCSEAGKKVLLMHVFKHQAESESVLWIDTCAGTMPLNIYHESISNPEWVPCDDVA